VDLAHQLHHNLKTMRAHFSLSLVLAATAFAPLSALVVSGDEVQMRGRPHFPVPATVSVPAAGVTVPMQNWGGRPVVEVRINGKGPYRFLVDTGANVTLIAADLSAELSLPAPDDPQVTTPDGSPPPPGVTIHELRIGDVALGDMLAVVMPLGGFFMSPDDAPRGVLSAAYFSGCLVTFDYPAKRVLIRKGELAAADSRSVFEYGEDQILPTVPIRVAGHETHVHLDTGSPMGLTLPAHFLRELPLASQPKDDGTARTPGGSFPISVASVQGAIELGQYKLDLTEVRFSDVGPGGGAPIGNIGDDVLRQFVVTLDSKNRRIRVSQ